VPLISASHLRIAGVEKASLKGTLPSRVVSNVGVAPCIPPALRMAAGLTLFICATCPAQQKASESVGQPRPRFEVASIKPSKNKSFIGVDWSPGGRLTANASLLVLISNAYHIRVFQILGSPAWASSDLYTIEAKATGSASRDALLLALQALLEDRFRLQIDRTTKPLPVYVLRLGKGGVKPQQANAGCAASDTNPAPPPKPGAMPCGRIMMRMSPTSTQLEGRGVTITQLIERLSYFVDRPIIDRTDYATTLNIDLEFTPVRDGFALFANTATPQSPATDDNTGIALSTALQDQLGLTLESAKAPVPVISIRHVERPSAN
jgi:uncharacterized protein (TIGR03435 family)